MGPQRFESESPKVLGPSWSSFHESDPPADARSPARPWAVPRDGSCGWGVFECREPGDAAREDCESAELRALTTKSLEDATFHGHEELEDPWNSRSPGTSTSARRVTPRYPAQFTSAGPPSVQIAYLLLAELYEFEGKFEDFVIVSDPPFLIIGELVAGGFYLHHAIFRTAVD